jgi:NAD(P)-dependent dehydrogenase (short-subunit alcohol dehydrogenase family)
MKLEGKKAIITGAAKGMGEAITLTLAREGADIVLTGRDTDALDEVAGKVEAMGRRALVVKCDVLDEEQVKNMVDAAKEFHGGLDILVNVSGVTGAVETPVEDIPLDSFDYVVSTNTRGTFLPIKHVMPTLKAQKSGNVVNIAGTSGLRGYPNRAAYSCSKWGVRGITRTVALEAGPYNVNVNAVCPGIVRTPRMEKLCRGKVKQRGGDWTFEKVWEEYVQDMALKRVTEPEDIANAVMFLCGPDSRQITGQEIAVDGGWDV